MVTLPIVSITLRALAGLFRDRRSNGIPGRTRAMSTIRKPQIGLLQAIKYLTAIIVVVVATGGNVFPFVVGLIVVTLPFVTWREIRNMEQENDPSRRPRQAIAKQGLVSQDQTLEQPATEETTSLDNNRVYPPSMYPDDLGHCAERNFA